MTASKATASFSAADREIVVTRTFEAPRDLVFRAWTDPRHVAHWFGPNGFTLTTHEMDVRLGGRWRYIMHGPDGKNYDNRIVYAEVVQHERLVYEHGEDKDNDPGRFDVTATFDDVGGKTKVTLRMVCRSAEQRAEVVKFGAIEGGNQTMARLAEYLPKMTKPFVVSREFEAPRDLVWKVWTDVEHLKKWWGPKGFVITSSRLDLRPGGLFHYCMRTPAGEDWWGRFVFKEVSAPHRLVWINSFSDENGGISRHPLGPTWPIEMWTVVTFAERAGKTTVTINWNPYNANEEEAKTFDSGRQSMTGGWGGTLEQLAAYLSAARAR